MIIMCGDKMAENYRLILRQLKYYCWFKNLIVFKTFTVNEKAWAYF